jgi:Domain of unknown function (DUF4349)
MKIVPFPKSGDPQAEAFAAQVEAALHGDSSTAEAESWRELRTDVRALVTPLSPELERELWSRILVRSAPRPRRARVRLRPRTLLASLRAWLASGLRTRLLATSGIGVVAAIVALALLAPWQGSQTGGPFAKSASDSSARPDQLGPAGPAIKAEEHASTDAGAAASAAAAAPEAASSLTPYANHPAPEARRVQQRAASLTLAPKPEAVQTVAGEVAQLAARDGGFVQSSQVQQRGTGGEATLQLSLPSARLSAALAELARLAPTRAQSQSLQDITDQYDADRTKLSDAVAERQALLRSLAKASTQGAIESLHARLALAAAAITRARTAFQSVSKRGSDSAVEVTVLGDAHASDSSSTLGRGLHDAGDVLKLALAVTLVALAVLVPLAIVLGLLALGWRMTRRRLRERALS